jgi:hypothetical protein
MRPVRNQSIGQQLWRWYQGVLSVLVSGAMICLSAVMPLFVAWLIGWSPRGSGLPGFAVLVGLLLAAMLWPMGVWMALQVPDTWRLMAWPPERWSAWRQEHQQ